MSAPGVLVCSYENLLERFRNISAIGNCGQVKFYPPMKSAFTVHSKSASNYDFSCFVYLDPWALRSSSKDTCRIIVKAEEVIEESSERGSKFFIKKSRVRVNYIDKTNKLVECIRYDYDFPTHDTQHPVFHAQLSDRLIDIEGEVKSWVNAQSINQEGLRCFEYVRIPTADMTLGAVLLSISADHMKSEFFDQFLGEFVNIQEKLPQPRIDDLRKSVGKGGSLVHLKPSHWYRRNVR